MDIEEGVAPNEDELTFEEQVASGWYDWPSSYPDFDKRPPELPADLQQYKDEIDSKAYRLLNTALQDPNYTPTMDDAKAIVCSMVWDHRGRWWANYSSEEFLKKMQEDGVGADKLTKTDPHLPSHPEVDHYFNGDMYDSAAAVTRHLLFESKFFDRLSQEQRDELAIYMAESLDPAYEDLRCAENEFTKTLVYDVKPSLAAMPKVAAAMVTHVAHVADMMSEEKYHRSFMDTMYYIDEIVAYKLRDMIPGVCACEKNQDLDKFIGQVFRCHGVSVFLNEIRAEIRNEDPTRSENARQLLLYLLGDLANKETPRPATVDGSVDEFYTAVFLEPGEYELNLETMEARIEMVAKVLEKNGIEPSVAAHIAELACGTGWLTSGLRKKGYKTIGLDKHPDMVKEARERRGGVFARFDWNDDRELEKLNEVLFEKESLDAIVINGRSMRHSEKPIKLMQKIADSLKPGGIFMFDTPDVTKEGSPQERKLAAIRHFMERFGYDPEWLKRYYFRMVGAPPGQVGEYDHYVDSWTPSAELVEMFANHCGFELVEKIVEENYDKGGSDNLYFVFRKADSERAKQLKEAADEKMSDYYSYDTQLKHRNQNGTIVYPQTHASKAF